MNAIRLFVRAVLSPGHSHSYAEAQAARQDPTSSAYKRYLLLVLMFIYVFNFLDRSAFAILLQDIKVDLSLSDTQIGLLTGIAASVFYAVMGIPIARWADYGNRVVIISLMTAVQCAAIALMGVAGSFLPLMLIRIIASVGEAGCVPPAHSLIADYFPREERPRAVARYKLGVPLAMLIGYAAAGWLNELYGWRVTLVLLALPGLALAALVWLTLREPRRPAAGSESALLARPPATSPEPRFTEICVTLWSNASFRHLLVAFCVWYLFTSGMAAWQPAYLIRSFGLETGQLGIFFALSYGVVAGISTYLGGELATRYGAKNEKRQLLACAVLFAVLSPVSVIAYLAPNHQVALGGLAVIAFCVAMTLGPIFATIQTLVRPRMRAVSIAVIFFFANLIGAGIGPLAVGVVSDALEPIFGKESLRYALVVMSPGFLWAAWHLRRASRTVARDIADASA